MTNALAQNGVDEGMLHSRRPFVGRAALTFLVWCLPVGQVALGLGACTFARVFHTPCPGCGLTRASRFLLQGDIVQSLHMHPMLVPIVLSNIVFALATVVSAWNSGSPFYFYRERFGKVALWVVGCVYGAAILLWIARFFGALGGPVPV
ncbi:hypothetical protein BH09MYX1_BH09MYX1_14820 [soil metagenome]